MMRKRSIIVVRTASVVSDLNAQSWIAHNLATSQSCRCPKHQNLDRQSSRKRRLIFRNDNKSVELQSHCIVSLSCPPFHHGTLQQVFAQSRRILDGGNVTSQRKHSLRKSTHIQRNQLWTSNLDSNQNSSSDKSTPQWRLGPRVKLMIDSKNHRGLQPKAFL